MEGSDYSYDVIFLQERPDFVEGAKPRRQQWMEEKTVSWETRAWEPDFERTPGGDP